MRQSTWKQPIWADTYYRYLRRGWDHGQAAHMADEWMARQAGELLPEPFFYNQTYAEAEIEYTAPYQKERQFLYASLENIEYVVDLPDFLCCPYCDERLVHEGRGLFVCPDCDQGWTLVTT